MIYSDYLMVLVGDMFIEESEALELGLIKRQAPPHKPSMFSGFDLGESGGYTAYTEYERVVYADAMDPTHFSCRCAAVILDDVHDEPAAAPPHKPEQLLLTYDEPRITVDARTVISTLLHIINEALK